MRANVKRLTADYLIFLLFFMASAALDGVISDVVYVLAFIAPVIYVILSDREENLDILPLITPKRSVATTLALTLAPSVIVIAGASLLTSYLIFEATGKTDSVNVGDSFASAAISFAIVPALTEELLFRYLPMRLLGERNKRVTVILSSICFALAHFSPFQLFYAFIAGVIFMAVDLATDSLLPSLIIHLINNLLSLIWIMYGHLNIGKIGLFVTVCLLLALSIATFFITCKGIKEKIKYVFSADEAYGFNVTPLAFIIPAAFLGASVFLG